MRSRNIVTPGAARGRFPRPNLTMRELIGLVLAFAVSNAFLAWENPIGASNAVVAGIWNGMLALYLGFAFVQAWIRSVSRWYRTGDADPPGPRRRWTALGVAEATVIGGTMICCVQILLSLAIDRGVRNPDWTVPLAILLIGSAAGVMLLRMWRRQPGDSLTGRGAEPTIEGGENMERGETF
jgi:hypothetical protein